MDLGKQLLEPRFQDLVLATLIELADEVASAPECVVGEEKGGVAEILSAGGLHS